MSNTKLLDTRDAAERLKLSDSYLAKLRVLGGGPRYFKLGRRVRYDPDDLAAWAQSSARNSTSEII